MLGQRIKQFVEQKESDQDPITAMYFSSYKVFTSVLDGPENYGLANDQKKAGGTIWVDNLHPTSAVHAIIANELNKMLSSIDPMKFRHELVNIS